MINNPKIIALDLQNATLENLENWFCNNDFITAETTKEYIRFRVKDVENRIQRIFVINDTFFGIVSKDTFLNIDIPSWFSDEFQENCIPIPIRDIEQYRAVIIDWIFNSHKTRTQTGIELKAFQKFKQDFHLMIFPHFTYCITCVDVEELGFNLKEFFQPLNQKFKAIHSEFRQYYPKANYLKDVKLTKIYIIEKYILGYTFRLENEPYEHFFYNIHFEDLMYQLTPFKFDDVKELTVDTILEKISKVGIENLTQEECDFLNNQK